MTTRPPDEPRSGSTARTESPQPPDAAAATSDAPPSGEAASPRPSEPPSQARQADESDASLSRAQARDRAIVDARPMAWLGCGRLLAPPPRGWGRYEAQSWPEALLAAARELEGHAGFGHAELLQGFGQRLAELSARPVAEPGDVQVPAASATKGSAAEDDDVGRQKRRGGGSTEAEEKRASGGHDGESITALLQENEELFDLLRQSMGELAELVGESGYVDDPEVRDLETWTWDVVRKVKDEVADLQHNCGEWFDDLVEQGPVRALAAEMVAAWFAWIDEPGASYRRCAAAAAKLKDILKKRGAAADANPRRTPEVAAEVSGSSRTGAGGEPRTATAEDGAPSGDCLPLESRDRTTRESPDGAAKERRAQASRRGAHLLAAEKRDSVPRIRSESRRPGSRSPRPPPFSPQTAQRQAEYLRDAMQVLLAQFDGEPMQTGTMAAWVQWAFSTVNVLRVYVLGFRNGESVQWEVGQ